MLASFTEEIKSFARAKGADLVGIASCDRYEHAPLPMSPQGHLPEAQSLIVLAIHHPDAIIELCGEPTPQDLGSYTIQYTMNQRLDHISYWIAKFLEERGFIGLPIPASNIWRYRPYKGLDGEFLPDLSQIHAATAAGLGEIGWTGLFLSPEYGPRQRLTSIITDAPLVPTPMYDGPPLCDRCFECVRACPGEAFTKETRGVNVVQIGGKTFRYCNKNKWRCAWAEHFDIDLSLPIPDEVNEEVILKTLEEHGRYRGTMGSCLRYCMPPHLRLEDPGYTRVYRRRRFEKRDSSQEGGSIAGKNLSERIKARAIESGVDFVTVVDVAQLEDEGYGTKEYLPTASSVIFLGMEIGRESFDANDKDAVRYLSSRYNILMRFAQLDICRYLDELGYDSMTETQLPSEVFKDFRSPGDCFKIYGAVITNAELASDGFHRIREMAENCILHDIEPSNVKEDSLTNKVKRAAISLGFDLVGVTSIRRMDVLCGQLSKKLDTSGFGMWIEDKGPIHGPAKPVVRTSEVNVKKPGDYLEDAYSVLVLGLHYPDANLDRAKEPPSEAVGPYAFAQYETQNQLGYLSIKMANYLHKLGFKAVITPDLCGLSSRVANPRGLQYDATACRFAAIAAGLGELGWNGMMLTPQYGVRQHFIAIVTDAPLEESPLYSGPQLCDGCMDCVQRCPVTALDKEASITLMLEDKTFTLGVLDRLRCDWAKRYGLVAEEGPGYLGAKIDVMPPDKITPDDICRAMKMKDPIQKHHTCIVEGCIEACRK
jgi:epoxyqueuosine reductase